MTVSFYLGTHQPHWAELTDVPLFISHRRLAGRKTLPRARYGGQVALDSGGFTEVSMFGGWRTTPREYVAAAARYDTDLGHLAFAAPQDWMCEPFMLAKTGLTVVEHQRRTVANFVELTDLWPAYSDADCPFMPVLQGWRIDDYLRCYEAYRAAGVDMLEQHTVGLGSVCRRQNTAEIAQICAELRRIDPGMPLHGFGVKTGGLAAYGHLLESADSMAWSYAARRSAPLPGCTGHINCANCLTYALAWRDRVLAAADGPYQPGLFGHDWEAAA